MKTFILLACAFVALFVSGCTTTAGAIDAATTKVQIQNGKYKGFTIAFPKELQATKLDVSIDPASGKITLKADEIKSSSQAIIESAGAAQAESIAALSKTVGDIVPILLKAATNPAAAAVEVAAGP